jgi:hypothetical protein
MLQELTRAIVIGSGTIIGKSSVRRMGLALGFAVHIATVEEAPNTSKVKITGLLYLLGYRLCGHPTQVEDQIQGGHGAGYRVGADRSISTTRGIFAITSHKTTIGP